jgi:hypothetical protein
MKMKGKVLFCSLVALVLQASIFISIAFEQIRGGLLWLIPLFSFFGVFNLLIFYHILDQDINGPQ